MVSAEKNRIQSCISGNHIYVKLELCLKRKAGIVILKQGMGLQGRVKKMSKYNMCGTDQSPSYKVQGS